METENLTPLISRINSEKRIERLGWDIPALIDLLLVQDTKASGGSGLDGNSQLS